jgi:hypothetical protein
VDDEVPDIYSAAVLPSDSVLFCICKYLKCRTLLKIIFWNIIRVCFTVNWNFACVICLHLRKQKEIERTVATHGHSTSDL